MELTAEHQLENKNLDPVFPGYEKTIPKRETYDTLDK
jgi:hypothetical protein